MPTASVRSSGRDSVKHQRQQEVIPRGDELQDDHGRHDGHGQRQHDLGEDAYKAGAVDDGSLLKFTRQLAEVAGKEQDVEHMGGPALGQDDAPKRIGQSQPIHHFKDGNDGVARGQKDGGHKEGDDDFLAGKRIPTQHVADHRGSHNHQQYRRDRDDNGVEEVASDMGLFPGSAVVLPLGRLGQAG